MNSVKARLLGLLLLISLPVFALAIFLATVTYRSEIRALEQAQITTADEYAIRTRIWLRGVLRSVEVVVASFPSGVPSTEQCQAMVNGVLRLTPTYKAMYVSAGKNGECHASADNAISESELKRLMQAFRAKPETAHWIPSIAGRFRYDTYKVQDKIYFAVYLRNSNNAGEEADGFLILTPDALDQIFDLGWANSATVVGVVANGTDMLAVRGASSHDQSWLPKQRPSQPLPSYWTSRQDNGAIAHYSARVVAEPDVIVLAYFDGANFKAALQRFVALSMAPLLILAMMYLASWRFIQNNIVEGIAGIEKAAKAEIEGQKAVVVPLDPKMPDDIRNVASAFNRMVTVASLREETLMAALKLNQNLMRELHHRVKNSLQVIQSYLALTRREQPDGGGEILRDAEAKVQVLAVAYRHALTDRGLANVPLEPFVRELLSSMSDAARRSRQSIVFDITTEAGLPVDRAIPLGLAIVQEAFDRLKETSCRTVRVILEKRKANDLHLTVSSDSKSASPPIVSRTLLGLKLQLGAIAVPAEWPVSLHWQITID